MKIVVNEPVFLFQNYNKNFNGYNISFLKHYATGIYTNSYKKLMAYITVMPYFGINPFKYDYYLSNSELSAIDILINFNGKPHHLLNKHPKCSSSIFKVSHVMDYADGASKANDALLEDEVDFLLGYTNHFDHCSFFRTFYPSFENKIISVPFGSSERFYNKNYDIKIRDPRILAIGAINIIKDDMRNIRELFPHSAVSHPLREHIRKNSDSYDFIHSMLPSDDKEKNTKVNMVKELQKHTFFINDLSIFNFPPARTFEGIAAGSILLGVNNKIYDELGFVDNVNCLLIDEVSSKSMGTLQERINNIDLVGVKQESQLLSQEYTHDKVAEKLYQRLCSEIR